ncbi:scavenger receptor class B member 1-like [Penaeus monodon]|uniref:scavenger receptor class B member 1-like n=1 Tax=Penaeus monodon TaxID=6687 RepID=UPI0018A72088|nr:scavenger receptor class B member 1-like [Penaeus monodon]
MGQDYDNTAFTVQESSSYPGETSQSFKSPPKRRKMSICQIVLLVLGVLAAGTGFAMLVGAYDAIFDSVLQSQMQVTEGSRAYDIWRLTPVPLFLRLYFFNLTNPDEFAKGAKPIVQQVGPYCYREYHEKQNLTFHPNYTVTFFQQRWWHWDQEMSGNNTRDDVITIVNAVPISAAWSVRSLKPALSSLNSMFNLLGEQLIVRATAGEIIFDGFQDPLLDWMQENMVAENGTLHNITDLLPIPPGLTDYDRFGWFYGVCKIDLWNRRRETDFFDAPCNRVSGSAGEMWPPNLKKDLVDFYSPDLCMTMKLFYKEESRDSNGLPGYRFWGTNNTFANDSTVPGNQCYCVKGTCAPMGMYGLIYVQVYVDGLEPDEDKHAFLMDVIPELGTPMYVAARMQINMRVIPYKGGFLGGKIDILSEVPDVYLPMLWFEEIAEMPRDMASELKALLFIMTTPTMDVMFSTMVLLGSFTVGLLVGLNFCRRKTTLYKLQSDFKNNTELKLYRIPCSIASTAFVSLVWLVPGYVIPNSQIPLEHEK